MKTRTMALGFAITVFMISAAPAEADPPVTRDVQSIGEPLVLPLTAQQLAKDQQFRRAMGFRSDEAYVTEIYARVARGDLPAASRNWAALLTADEAAEVGQRLALSRLVGPIPDGTAMARLTPFGRYLAQHLDEFGGQYFDQAAGGTAVVLMTGHVAQHSLALSALLGGYRDRLRVKQAGHTYQELTALTRTLSADMDWLRGLGVGIASYGPDVSANAVVVRVERLTPIVESTLKARYGGSPLVVAQGKRLQATGASDTQAPPMKGGLAIWRCKDAGSAPPFCPPSLDFRICASGFMVTDGSRKGVIFAGHCGGGATWLQGAPNGIGDYTVGDTETS